jgi:malate dehydrogenase (oxaloacetate-decarboxylating)
MDLFVGLSGPGLIRPESLELMNPDALVFAMANPTPEVTPEEAGARVRVMATGRSDYPNQINNVLCFPGIFRGALDAGATTITEGMKLAAADAIAAVASDDLAADRIVPSALDPRVGPEVAAAVAAAARVDGVA